jgi:hypothetical protein
MAAGGDRSEGSRAHDVLTQVASTNWLSSPAGEHASPAAGTHAATRVHSAHACTATIVSDPKHEHRQYSWNASAGAARASICAWAQCSD